MERIEKRGGAGRGQGRKPISPSGEKLKDFGVRLSAAQIAKLRELGGAQWLRDQLDKHMA